MPRAPKSCGRYGCPAKVVARAYCPAHEAEQQRARPLSPTSIAANSRHERNRRSETVNAWVQANGWLCPGWRRPPHQSHDLTAAHAVPVVHGGGNGPLTVLCRACNSRQATRLTP
jgi:hypothetical protein